MGIAVVSMKTNLPNIVDSIAPDKHLLSLFILKEYTNIFSTGPHDFGFIKESQHQLDFEDSRLF